MTRSHNAMLPFSAVVAQDDAKLALLLVAMAPRLGGVLLRGDKGSAKTTLARGLARLLPGDAPFVELPLGATEDRVLGSIDVTALLTDGDARFRPGLLAAAHGGVLYVDEINLLADHLVDALLDVAVSGVNRVEREGVSHTHPARFVLVASMNPEEGELRPQLLDRFGLAVDVTTPVDVAERARAVTKQLEADHDPSILDPELREDAALAARLASARSAPVPHDVVATACRVAVAVGAEGLRADLMLCRAAAAHAGWENRAAATDDDLRRVAPFVLAHRRRRTPFEEPGISDDELDDAFAPPDDPELDLTDGRDDDIVEPDAAATAPGVPVMRTPQGATGRSGVVHGTRGRYVRAVPASESTTTIAAVPTAVSTAIRRATDDDATATGRVDRRDLREPVHDQRTGRLVVLAVDTSGSMGADRRIAAAKGFTFGVLTDAYRRRDRVAVVAFRGERAELVMRPTGSIEIARARLEALPTGGTTPLAGALDLALDVARGGRREGYEPLLVLVTDGRATAGGDDPVAAARDAAARVAAARVPGIVVDAEQGPSVLGLASEVAAAMKAECIPLAQFGATDPRQ
jgi:magnesium chelatase subunit D